jgi:hypothetical protein
MPGFAQRFAARLFSLRSVFGFCSRWELGGVYQVDLTEGGPAITAICVMDVYVIMTIMSFRSIKLDKLKMQEMM